MKGIVLVFILIISGTSEILAFQDASVAKEIAKDSVLMAVDVSAAPACGMAEFYKLFINNLQIPKRPDATATFGKLFVEFIVEKDGSITDPHVVNGPGNGWDEVALEAFQKSCENISWSAGIQDEKPVRQRMVVAITCIKFG